MRIAILGAGNGGFAATVDLTLQGHEINLYEGYAPNTLKDLEEISYFGIMGEGKVRPSVMTTDISVAIKDVDLILNMTPALGHSHYAQLLAPQLQGGEMIILSPGHTFGILNFAKTLRDNGAPKDLILAETDTLPYVARKTDQRTIRISHRWEIIYIAGFPSTLTSRVSKVFSKLYPKTVSAKNVLETSLKNQGAVMHPVGMILNSGWIENEVDFRFYYDGFSPSVCRVAERIDRERMNILSELGLDDVSLEELFFLGGFLPERADFYHAIAKSEANKFIPAPKTLQHRFIDEDLLHGLIPMQSLARKINVDCPTIASLIKTASLLLNREFEKEAVTLDTLNLQELTKEELLQYVNQGH